MEKIKNAFVWVFSRYPEERVKTSQTEKLIDSMRITSKCRFNASNRLALRSKTSFFITTILSLGLILIPLLQNSGVKLNFTASVLNMLQIFLAVSVLIYSVTIGTARYDLRSRELDECGQKIKRLIRDVRTLNEKNPEQTKSDLDKINSEYNQVLKESENHSRSDYKLSKLEMTGDYNITGLKRIFLLFTALVQCYFPYLLPAIFLGAEIIFITDMLSITKILSPFLNAEIK